MTDLKKINSKDNNKSIVAWKNAYKTDNYKNNTKQIFNGSNAYFKFSVNPYPNENDALGVLKVTAFDEETSKKHHAVQNQLIRTGYKVDNVLAGDQKRIVAEVYHPDGTYLKEAQAFLVTDDNIAEYKKQAGFEDIKVGEILFKMPKGALEDKNSVFNTEKYRGIHNLKVNVYARPRTKAEFEAALPNGESIPGKTEDDDNNTYDINGEAHYTETGAGTKEIDHDGKKVTIDLQGIDRYDHYNLLGDLTINLDDTKYYDQVFDEKVAKPTDKMTSVKPNVPVEIAINDTATEEGKANKPSLKTSAEMNQAKTEARAKAELDEEFLKIAREKGWEITVPEGDVSKITVKAPKTAKPGEFIAIPYTYTYTNGSIDNHWFHFVVQESDNNRPEYFAPVGMPGESLSTTPQLPTGDVAKKKLQPKTYELAKNEDGTPITEYKDDKGNVWTNIKVDPQTGVVTADVPDNANIKGGERLFVPIKVNYEDEQGNKFEENVKAEFVSKVPGENKPEYKTPVGLPGSSLTTTPVAETSPSLVKPAGYALEENQTYTDDKGNTWTVSINPTTGEVTAKVPDNAEAGSKLTVPVKVKYINPSTQKEYFKTIHAEFVAKKDYEAEVIHEYDKEIPFETKEEIDENLPAGEIKVITEGKVGKKHYTFKQNVKNDKKGKLVDGKLVENEFVLDEKVVEEKQDRLVKVGVKPVEETVKIHHEVEIVEDETLPAGQQKVIQEGEDGLVTIKKTRDPKTGNIVMTKEETKAPKKKIIHVGKKPASNNLDVNKLVPVEIVWKKDPTMDVTLAKPGDLTPGKVETVVTNQYNPVTGKIESVEKTVVTPAKQEIVVGVKKFTGDLPNTINETIPFDTEIIFDDTKEAGTKEVVSEGKPGVNTKEIVLHFENGEQKSLTEKVVKTEKPVKRIIKVGSKTSGTLPHKEEIPFEVEVVKTKDLKKGESRVKQQGEVGEKLTTYTIENSKVKGEPKVTRTKEPKKHIIEIGDEDVTGEVSHPVTENIPFKVEVIEDPTLLVGTKKIDQEGVAGVKVKQYTQTIKNGQADGAVKISVVSEQAPKNHIIRVGTKPVEGNTHEVNKDVPVDVIKETDPTLNAGEIKVETIPGHVTSKLVNKIVDGKVVTEEVPVVTPAKQVIKVGTKPVSETVTIPHKVEYVDDPSLALGTEVVDQEGKDGQVTVKTTLDPTTGKVSINKETTTEAQVKKIRRGTKAPNFTYEHTNVLPFETVFEFDDTLEAGTTKEVQAGINGETKTTVSQSYANGKLTDQTVSTPVETKKAQKRIVKIGTKGELKYSNTCPIPYPVEIRENPELEAGKSNVVQEGKAGSKTTHYTQTLKNGKGEGNPTITEGETTQPTPKIIEVGTKPQTCPIAQGTETPIEKEVPVEVEYLEDPTLEEGKEQKGKIIPGKVESKVVSKVVDGKVVNTVETKVTPAKQIIRKGTKKVDQSASLPNTAENQPGNPAKPSTPSSPEDSSSSSLSSSTESSAVELHPQAPKGTESNSSSPSGSTGQVASEHPSSDPKQAATPATTPAQSEKRLSMTSPQAHVSQGQSEVNSQAKATLPQTGEKDSTLPLALLSLVSSSCLLLGKKRKED